MTASLPQNDIVQSTKVMNLFMAGQGSGKTFTAGMISKSFIDHFPKVRGLIAANTYNQLNRSTMFRIREFWKACGMTEYNYGTQQGDYVSGRHPPAEFDTDDHNYESYHNIISFRNGCVIYVGSLENYKSLDGMEIGWAILDETKDTREEALTEVIMGRLRQTGIYISDRGKKTPHLQYRERDFNPLYIFTSPAKVPWLNDMFGLHDYEKEITDLIFQEDKYFKKETDDKMITISSAYLNKDNLPEGWIDRQKGILPSHLHPMLIYGSPFTKSGGEFYKCFDRLIHVEPCPYDKHLPLHITFDFNVAPYITLCIWQIDDNTATQIDEICLSSPMNSTPKLCEEFKRKYQKHTAGLFIYGDPSGKARDTRDEEGRNDYHLIDDKLFDFRPISRVSSSAPSVVMRANFINTVLESEFAGIKIRIDPKCINTIADYTYLKEKSDGTKLKKRITDKLTGASFEEYGHTSDANDYFLTEAFAGEYMDYQHPPDNTAKRSFGTTSTKRF